MGRKLLALCLLVAATSFAGGPAAAQFGCPPGETFIPTLNRCVPAGGVGENRCPPGSEFDWRENRCRGAEHGDRCPPGQEFDWREGRCIGGPPAAGPVPQQHAAPPAAPPKCPQGQTFDAHQNKCVAPPPTSNPAAPARPAPGGNIIVR